MRHPLRREATDSARRRELAGDRRAGSYARGLARRKQYEFIRRNWVLFAAVVLGTGLLLFVTALVTPSDFGRGLVVGGVAVGVGSALWLWVVQATGTSPAMMGDLGEQWTASELRKLRRAGWIVVNHLVLRVKDIDHVLVGPGGIFAVETKWTATPWQREPVDPRIRDAAEQARRNAHDLSIWHDLKHLDVGEVRGVVFLWGAGAHELPPLMEVSGVTVVSGPQSVHWRRGLPGGALAGQTIDAAWAVLDKQARRRDPLEAESSPLPPSPVEWAQRILLLALSVCAGSLLSALAISRGWSLLLDVIVLLLLVGVGLAGLAVGAVRHLALAWTVGVMLTGVVAIASVAGSLAAGI